MSKVVLELTDDEMQRARERAAEAGMTVSDYLLREVRKSAGSSPNEEVFRRLMSQDPIETTIDAADILREERDSR